MLQPVWCSIQWLTARAEHDVEVRLDGLALVVVDRSDLQVVFGHPEAFLDPPEVVVSVDDELGRRVAQVGGVALQPGQGAGFGLQVAWIAI
jgi:hypothetical protein